VSPIMCWDSTRYRMPACCSYWGHRIHVVTLQLGPDLTCEPRTCSGYRGVEGLALGAYVELYPISSHESDACCSFKARYRISSKEGTHGNGPRLSAPYAGRYCGRSRTGDRPIHNLEPMSASQSSMSSTNVYALSTV
jgi:hypothetical protein